MRNPKTFIKANTLLSKTMIFSTLPWRILSHEISITVWRVHGFRIKLKISTLIHARWIQRDIIIIHSQHRNCTENIACTQPAIFIVFPIVRSRDFYVFHVVALLFYLFQNLNTVIALSARPTEQYNEQRATAAVIIHIYHDVRTQVRVRCVCSALILCTRTHGVYTGLNELSGRICFGPVIYNWRCKQRGSSVDRLHRLREGTNTVFAIPPTYCVS